MNDRAVSVVVSRIRFLTRTSTQATARPTRMPPTDSRANSIPTSRAVTDPPIATMAVRRMVIAVASLNRDSPSRIVTTRRGRPIRRATAVAATASGGATTAPERDGRREGDADEPPGHQPDPGGGEDDEPDGQQPDDVLVGAEVDERGADRRRVEQGRQDAEQDQLRPDRDLGHRRDERHQDADRGQHQWGRGSVAAGQRGDADDDGDHCEEGQGDGHDVILSGPPRRPGRPSRPSRRGGPTPPSRGPRAGPG